jgi:hypothetical protein
MVQGFSTEGDIHSHCRSRNSPLYHTSAVRRFINLLSVSATGPSPDPNAHSLHPRTCILQGDRARRVQKYMLMFGKSLNIVYISVELQQVPTLKCTEVHKNIFELLCTLLKT